MTARIEIPGPETDETPRCTDPAELRRRAKDARGRLALIRLEAMNLDRQADQLEHEARLWDLADAAEDALNALQQKTAGLEAAAEGTLAAKREAEDELRADRRHVARRKGEVTRAENGPSRDAQDEAAVRLHKSEQRCAEAERDLAAAAREHQGAEAAVDAQRTALREASSAYQRALEAGYSPGVAPRTSPLQVGLGRPEDMTPEERQYFAMLALTSMGTGAGSDRDAAPKRDRFTTNAEFAAQDPSKFRMVRQGNSMIAVPPVLMPAPGR